MGVLVWTFSCLTLLALMSCGLFYSLADHHMMNKYLSANVEEVDRTLSALYVDDVRVFHDNAKVTIEPPKGRRPVRSKTSFARPRLTSKIHVTSATFASLRSQTGSSDPIAPAERIVHNLLKQHYPGIGGYTGQSDGEAIASLLDALSEAFNRYEGKCSYKDVKILANFELQNQKLQEPYWQILSGKKTQDDSWNSFLSFISFNQNRQVVSLWLAPPAVLRAIFDDKSEEDVAAFVEKRYKLFKSLKQAKKSGEIDQQTSVESEFRALCEKQLPSWLPGNDVDMSVSSTPPKK